MALCPGSVNGGFAGNDWLDVLETQQAEFVLGLASNARLDHRAVKRMTRPMLGFKSLWASGSLYDCGH